MMASHQAIRSEREAWERDGRQPMPCPECPAVRRNPDTLRVHRAIAHPTSSGSGA